MDGIWQKLVITLSSAVALVAATSPVFAAVVVKNTSAYAGAGRWNWTIFVDADPETLAQIECVEYVLHSTFPDPKRKVCNQPQTKFAHSTNGWGTFTVKVNVLYKDGRVEALEHPLALQQDAAPTPLDIKVTNTSREIEPGWWDWSVRLEGANSELDRVRCVEYTLHPTFPKPVRLVCSRPDRFKLTARGWGAFTIKVKLLLKDGSIRELSHPLELR